MDRNEEIVNAIVEIKKSVKDQKQEENKLKEELFSNLMEEVGPVETSVEYIPKSLFETKEEAEAWGMAKIGPTYRVMVSEAFLTGIDQWKVKFEKLKEYVSVKREIGAYSVSKIVYSMSPDFDLDLLKKLDIDLYNKITKLSVSIVLDEEALAKMIQEEPKTFVALQQIVKAGDVRVRLDIKELK